MDQAIESLEAANTISALGALFVAAVSFVEIGAASEDVDDSVKKGCVAAWTVFLIQHLLAAAGWAQQSLGIGSDDGLVLEGLGVAGSLYVIYFVREAWRVARPDPEDRPWFVDFWAPPRRAAAIVGFLFASLAVAAFLVEGVPRFLQMALVCVSSVFAFTSIASLGFIRRPAEGRSVSVGISLLSACYAMALIGRCFYSELYLAILVMAVLKPLIPGVVVVVFLHSVGGLSRFRIPLLGLIVSVFGLYVSDAVPHSMLAFHEGDSETLVEQDILHYSRILILMVSVGASIWAMVHFLEVMARMNLMYPGTRGDEDMSWQAGLSEGLQNVALTATLTVAFLVLPFSAFWMNWKGALSFYAVAQFFILLPMAVVLAVGRKQVSTLVPILVPCLVTLFSFAFAYASVGLVVPERYVSGVADAVGVKVLHGPDAFWYALYFSVVSWTSLGLGDVSVAGTSFWLVAWESLFGVTTVAFAVSAALISVQEGGANRFLDMIQRWVYRSEDGRQSKGRHPAERLLVDLERLQRRLDAMLGDLEDGGNPDGTK